MWSIAPNVKLISFVLVNIPLKAEDPAYYESFIKTIDSPYLIQPSSRSLGDAIAEAGSLDGYDEDRGDRCLSSLMGTWNEDDR